MSKVANIIVGTIAVLHVCVLVFEMFFWDKPAGEKVLAANLGLYNGFLAAGLFWGLSLGANGTSVKVFFLCCVLIAGLYGAASTGKITILFAQAIPAAIALALMLFSASR